MYRIPKQQKIKTEPQKKTQNQKQLIKRTNQKPPNHIIRLMQYSHRINIDKHTVILSVDPLEEHEMFPHSGKIY